MLALMMNLDFGANDTGTPVGGPGRGTSLMLLGVGRCWWLLWVLASLGRWIV
jgi:hypothetical protein